ncbi:type 1 glutamine amidotransferase domain-containing protein [[Eubacterium] cellulosolvens]
MDLSDKKIAILAEDGYEDLELWYPKIRLEEEGVQTVVLARGKKSVLSKHGYEVRVDQDIAKSNVNDFDGVIVPGGVQCPDKLRRHQEFIDFVKNIGLKGKLVAAICHGPWLLISAELTKGKKMTCFFSIKDDLINSGAIYHDNSVVVDGSLVTSRKPEDLPEFCKAIIKTLKNQTI